MSTFIETEHKISGLVENITKCYLLLNYAYNTEDEIQLYKEEFKNRYICFYKELVALEEEIDYKHFKEIGSELKKIFKIDFYKSKMSFLDSVDLGQDPIEIDNTVDSDFDAKCSTITVRLNFYHNNRYEFGDKTRLHANIERYSVINPSTSSEEEDIFIFNALSDYFMNNYLITTDKNNKKLILEDM